MNDHENQDSCPFCNSNEGCDHLVALFDFQFGEAMAGYLYDNPQLYELLTIIERRASSEHALATGENLRRIRRSLSEWSRDVSPQLEKPQLAELEKLIEELQVVTTRFGSPTDEAASPAQMSQLYTSSDWTPCDCDELVLFYDGQDYRYLTKVLKEAGATGEVHMFHGGQAGMTSDICALFAEDPAAVVDRAESILQFGTK